MIKYKDVIQTFILIHRIYIFALEKLENLLTSLCMKLVQEVRFELLPVRVQAIKGGQYKMVMSRPLVLGPKRVLLRHRSPNLSNLLLSF